MCYNIIMLYFDNAATTKISKSSLEEYIKASQISDNIIFEGFKPRI